MLLRGSLTPNWLSHWLSAMNSRFGIARINCKIDNHEQRLVEIDVEKLKLDSERVSGETNEDEIYIKICETNIWKYGNKGKDFFFAFQSDIQIAWVKGWVQS